jgi:hypothetical protein
MNTREKLKLLPKDHEQYKDVLFNHSDSASYWDLSQYNKSKKEPKISK